MARIKDRIFNVIHEYYPSHHDLKRKWELADKILALPIDDVVVVKKIDDETEEIEHLTIGQVINLLPKTIEYIGYECSECDYMWEYDRCRSNCVLNEALTTEDGGKIRRVLDENV